MTKEFSGRRLDVQAFAEAGAALNGQEPVRKFERLMAETQGRSSEAPVNWSATGELRNPGHVHPDVWLHLDARTVLSLTCQRCLGPVDVPVEVERSFRFVADEAIAAAQDDESQEDVLALSHALDLVELVEDELLMAMPLAPRHEACPEPLELPPAGEVAEDEPASRPHPFAILGKLRIGKPEA